MTNDAKAPYYRDKISICSNQKEPFEVVEQLLHQKEKSINFPLTILKQNWQRILTSFISKLAPIRVEFDTSGDVGITNDSISSETDHDKSIANLEVLLPASKDEIYKIIAASPPKSCDTDPIPTWFLKKSTGYLFQ